MLKRLSLLLMLTIFVLAGNGIDLLKLDIISNFKNIVKSQEASQSIRSLRVDLEGDVTHDSAKITFDIICEYRPKEKLFVALEFACVDAPLTTKVFDTIAIERTQTGKYLNGLFLESNSKYIVSALIVDENQKEVWRSNQKDSIVIRTLPKPIELIPIASSYDMKSGKACIKAKTKGIGQYCKPVKVILRICGMCPCGEYYLGECQTKDDVNYYETSMKEDGVIEHSFTIPECYRKEIKQFFAWFVVINPDDIRQEERFEKSKLFDLN